MEKKTKQKTKFYTFSEETLSSCLTVSISNLKNFISIYPALLKVIDPRHINFGIWIRGSTEMVEYINPALDPEEKALRLKQLLPVIAKFQSVSGLLIRREDRKAFFDHIRESRLAAVEDMALRKTLVNGYLKISDCSSRIMSFVDNELLEDAEQIICDVVNCISYETTMVKAIADILAFQGALYDHTAFVTIISAVLARSLNISDAGIRTVSLGALFHDIGITQLDIPDYYVKRLDPVAQKVYERHPTLGVQALTEIEHGCMVPFPEEVYLILLQHHERMNGIGFPNGKNGRLSAANKNGIHFFAAIVGLADAFAYYFEDLQDKVHYTARSATTALARLDGSFDPEIMKCFLTMMSAGVNEINYDAIPKKKSPIVKR